MEQANLAEAVAVPEDLKIAVFQPLRITHLM